MAKSKAKKLREHLVRQGKMDPNMRRGTWGAIDGVGKRDKDMRQSNLQELKREDKRIQQKYKGRSIRDIDGYAL
jgi:hypothetical protein